MKPETMKSDVLPMLRKNRVALVLQGGGALGAYQAGVYQALHENDLAPDWVVGTSIGAINAAIIAGNEPAERVGKLRAFCEEITANPLLDSFAALDALTPKGHHAAHLRARRVLPRRC